MTKPSFKEELEKLITIKVTLIADEDVQLLANDTPVFTITNDQKLYTAELSNPKAIAAVTALIHKANKELLEGLLEDWGTYAADPHYIDEPFTVIPVEVIETKLKGL